MRLSTANKTDRLTSLSKAVRSITSKMGTPLPAEFLATVMSGLDPRPIDSSLYTLVRKIALREFTGNGEPYPTKEEWAVIVDLVLNSGLYQRARVTLDQSIRAAEKLMDFLHAKLRAVETTNNSQVTMDVKPLTGAALDAFKAKFENEF